MKVRLLLSLLLLLGSLPVLAAIEEYAFDSPEQKETFDELTYELRCPKCLNSNIAGSDAPVAAELREEIYEQVQAGRDKDEIVAFMSERYGDFINYRPPLRPGTLVLWFGPLLLLLAGLFIVRRTTQSSQRGESAGDLSPEEQRKLRDYLSSHPDR